jgi:hypothetical protein
VTVVRQDVHSMAGVGVGVGELCSGRARERQEKFFCGFLSGPLPRLTTSVGLSHWGKGLGQAKFSIQPPSLWSGSPDGPHLPRGKFQF